MKTEVDPITEVAASAQSMDAAKTETIATCSVGDVVRQGDVYLVCLDCLPDGKPTLMRQLAPGSTRGSRHILTGRCRIVNANGFQVAELVSRLIKGADVSPTLVGPAFECLGAVTVTHPEHGHKVLPKGSAWVTLYQRAFSAVVRRVLD